MQLDHVSRTSSACKLRLLRTQAPIMEYVGFTFQSKPALRFNTTSSIIIFHPPHLTEHAVVVVLPETQHHYSLSPGKWCSKQSEIRSTVSTLPGLEVIDATLLGAIQEDCLPSTGCTNQIQLSDSEPNEWHRRPFPYSTAE